MGRACLSWRREGRIAEGPVGFFLSRIAHAGRDRLRLKSPCATCCCGYRSIDRPKDGIVRAHAGRPRRLWRHQELLLSSHVVSCAPLIVCLACALSSSCAQADLAHSTVSHGTLQGTNFRYVAYSLFSHYHFICRFVCFRVYSKPVIFVHSPNCYSVGNDNIRALLS